MAVKILRVGMTYPRDVEPGAGLHMYYHSKYSEDPQNELIITSKRPGDIIDNGSGVNVVEITIDNPKLGTYDQNFIYRGIAFVRKLRSQIDFKNKAKKYIDNFKPDIVHIYSPIPILTALYAKRKWNSKIVVSLHGSDALRIGKSNLLKRIMVIPDAVVTVGDNIEGMLNGARTKKPIVYIGNGVDLNEFKDLKLERMNQFIHVANLRWQKGQQYLIEGFKKFHDENPKYKLVVIGDGEQRDTLKNLCERLDISHDIIFEGTRGRDYIVNELNKSKAFVLTSVSEGFPKVIIESMAAGTPVISSDVGNVKNVVGDSGIIFPQKDSEGVFEAMKLVSNDDDRWRIMSEKSKEISKRYGWEEQVRKINKVYSEVLEK